MNKKLGRNDSCHCGSGKKYKVCHGQDNIKSLQPWMLILIIILGLFWYLLFESEPTVNNNNNNKSNPLILQPKSKSSLPSEPAPPGKVWSPEHNHWHDDPKASIPTSTNAEQNEPVSKPPGTPPPGKVWSPEHNHWHDKN